MKVLIVTNMMPLDEHPYFGIFVSEQIEGVRKIRREVDFDIHFINGIKSKINYLLSVFQINLKIFKNEYDIIHIHFGISGLFLLFNPFLKVPVVTTLHGSDVNSKSVYSLIYIISKAVIKRSTRIIYLNDKMISKLKINQKKFIYLPCGVDIIRFTPKREREGVNIRIGFPGNPSRPEKNYQLFSEIISVLKSKWKIEIEVVIFHGLTRDEVGHSLNSLKLLLMTSLSEGSPQIVKEAMSCNIPIISTNVGDVSVLLKGVVNCSVIDSFKAEDFIVEIVSILKLVNPKTNGRERLLKLGLDEKSTSDKIYQVYKNLRNVV